MVKIISINAGSSTLKWQLFNMPEKQLIAKGMIDRLGKKNAVFTAKFGDGKKFKQEEPIETNEVAATLILTRLKELKIVDKFEDIKAVGHRVVAGGEIFKKSSIITSSSLDDIKRLSEYAPLHNPVEAYYIDVFSKLLPEAIQVAVFDSSFFSTLSEVNYLYSIDKKYYDKYGVRKYGAHGTSHRFVSQRAGQLLSEESQKRVITLHLGSGASISAIKNGQAIDTSMGFTPLAGITMSTRSGDIDVSLIPYMMKKLNIYNVDEFIDILNKKSGLLGISGVSNDMRDLEEIEDTNDRAQLALDIFVNRVVKYVGAYVAELGGLDALVFTAGVGENGVEMRERICQRLGFLGIKIDPEKNNVRGQEVKVNADNAPVDIFVIPTNEELMIAMDTYDLLGKVTNQKDQLIEE
ncbi:acetate kinase [Companilactobacillus sp. RD055328]|uniref:acetate/propionate family kinase n=1 Tax=Companilactobacillus sp. RD055328 TaxID=2916634 RepID=UPI001FC8DF39|nr:acetate kinase [Companilactobacillus sp. RD055328]GKQ43419.1 acetate kinase [Companilactobacillus sp. RD055328]